MVTRRPHTVVFLVSNFLPAGGGTVSQVRNQAQALTRHGVRAVVLTKPHATGLPPDSELDGVRVVRRGPAPAEPDTSWSRIDKARTLAAWTAWLLRRRRQVDAVQAVLHADFLLPTALAGLGHRTGMLWVGRGDAERNLGGGSHVAGRWARLPRRLLARRGFHVTLTDAMAGDLDRLGLPAATVIPTPIDLDRFRPPSDGERSEARARLRVEGGTPTVTFIGHLVPEKGVHQLIRAAAILRDGGQPCRLLILGEDRSRDRSYLPELRHLADDVGLADAVRFEGFKDDPLPYLWASDALVLPSEREGLPNVLLEGMACGVPCVAPPSAGGDEALREGGGVVPEDNSPEQLARGIGRVLPADGGGRTAAATTLPVQRFSPDAVAQRYMRLYESLPGWS